MVSRPSAFIKSFTLVMGLSIALISAEASANSLPTGKDLLLKMEQNATMATDMTANVTLTQQKTGQGVKTIQMNFNRRDQDHAFLIMMTAPESDKGNGYLRVGDNFWMYRHNTRTFQHVNRDENIGGTNAQGEDFEERKFSELYAPMKDSAGLEKISLDTLGKIPVYKFQVIAKVNDVGYPKKTYWVRTDNFLTLKEQSFALSGTLMQTAYFLKYTAIKGKFIPVEQLFIDEFDKGNKTKMNISGISTDPLKPEIFTKAYLENLSK